MRKWVTASLVLFYIAPFFIIYLNSAAYNGYIQNVYNSDILFPFSLYQGLLNPSSSADWVFGGYTPFLELLIGFVLWLLSRDIHLTLRLYSVFQTALAAFSLLFLARTIFGKNQKALSLVVIASALPLYLFSFGFFNAAWPLFAWYLHVTTLSFGLITFALLLRLLQIPAFTWKSLPTFLLLSVLIVAASVSDALFMAQFAAPAVGVIILLMLLKFVSFRRGAYTAISVLYSTAGGLALYRLPALWGGQRLAFYGSYIKPSPQLVLENLTILCRLIPAAWGGSAWGSAVWIVFYAACLAMTLFLARRARPGSLNARGKLVAVLAFFVCQMIFNVTSGLISLTLVMRYFLPLIFIPLFWGWPFLVLACPPVIKALRGPTARLSMMALGFAAIILLVVTLQSHPVILKPAGDTLSLVDCLDKNEAQYHLQRGMANYWQARPITLFSKTHLAVVQVDPDLHPFRILNNSDGYRDLINFVIISNNPEPGQMMDRGTVINQFGQPSATFFCAQSEVLVYNPAADNRIRSHFATYFSEQE